MLNQLLIALRNHEESLRDELTNQKLVFIYWIASYAYVYVFLIYQKR